MATPNGRGKDRTGRKTRTTQARGRKSSVFRRRALAIAVQLAFAVGVGTLAFSPTDAAAQACPPDVTTIVTISGSVTNTGVCNINAGGQLGIAVPGSLTNAPTGTLNNYNGLFSSGSLSNAGTLNNKSGTLYNAGGSLSNLATGTINNTGAATTLANSGSFSNAGTLNNSGSLFNRDGLSGPASLSNEVTGKLYNNSHSYLWNYAGLSNAGKLNNNSGATLFNFGSLSSAGTLSNAGTLSTIGTLSNSGTWNNSGKLYTAVAVDSLGNVISIGSLSNGATGVLNNNSGGLLRSYGSLSNAGTLNNNSGATLENTFGGTLSNTLSNAGTLNNNSGATLDNSSVLLNSGSLSNAGTLTNNYILRTYSTGTLSNAGTLNNNSFVDNSGSLSNTGTLNIRSYTLLRNSGNMSNSGTLHLYSGYYSPPGRLSNPGTFSNSGSIINDGAITNTGTFTVTSTGIVDGVGTFTQTAGTTTVDGKLSGSSVTFTGGILTGTGIVDPPNSIVIGASAIVQPGLPIGTLTFQGDTQFGGELDIEIGGASFYDILSVVGAIHFSPGSKLKFIFEGYDPQVGDSFQFLDSDFLDGFSNLSFLYEGLGPGFGFQLADAGNGNLVFDTLQAPSGGGNVPEPGTVLLVALGLVGIAGLRLRQRPAARCRMSMQ